MGRKHAPGCLCCGTTCEDACVATSPLTTATVSIANGTSDNSFSITFPTSADFDCSTSASECRIKDVTKEAEGDCTTDWFDAGISGITCNCGLCDYVPADPDDPIPFPTPDGDPFPATTFNRVELSTRWGWKVCEWRQRGYRTSLSITPGSTTGKVILTVFYEVAEVQFYNWLYAQQYRHRAHTYACPGGPSPTSTGAWTYSPDPFPLEDPPYPCERDKPIVAGDATGCEDPTPGTPVCDAFTTAIAGYNQTLSCHPAPPCDYLVSNEAVYWIDSGVKLSRWLNTTSDCYDACFAYLLELYPTGFPGDCATPFDTQSIRYSETYTYQSSEIDCSDLRDGAITLSRTDSVTSDQSVELVPENDYSCGDGTILGSPCGVTPLLELDSTAATITVPWQVTVTFA